MGDPRGGCSQGGRGHTGSSATPSLCPICPLSLCQLRDASATAPGQVPCTASNAKELQCVPSVLRLAPRWESSLIPSPARLGPKSHEVGPKIAGY